MKITPIEHGLDLLASDLVRSEGLHASGIYNALYHELEPNRYTDTPPDALKMALGTAWEQYLEAQLVRSGLPLIRPGEFMTKEGVAFSPDGLIQNGETVLAEYKLTWQSSRNSIDAPQFSKYWTQIKYYCHNLDLTKARLYIFHVNGDYSRPFKPVLKVYAAEFSTQELKDNQEMLHNFARSRKLL